MKRLLKFVLISILALLIVGCGNNASDKASSDQGSSDENDSPKLKTDPLTIITGAQGGSWYPIGGAIAELMNLELEGSPVTSVPGGGTSNPVAVSKGEADIGFSYGPTLFSALQGTDPYNEAYTNLKAVARLHNLAWHVIVDKSTGITSFNDIVENQIGVRWVPNLRGTGDEWIAQKVIQEYGFTYDDIKNWGGQMNFVSMEEAVSLWRDRHIDMYSTHTLYPAPTVTEATLARDANFLSIDDEIIARLKEKYELVEAVLPAGTYKGQDEDVKTVTMPVVLFARDDLPDEIVYMLAKLLDQEHEYLINVHTLFKEFDPTTAWKDTGIELHPGAEQYYRDAGYME